MFYQISINVIRVLVITFFRYKSAFVPLYFRNIQLIIILPKHDPRIFYLSDIAKFVLFTDIFMDDLYTIHFDRTHKSRKNTLIRAILPQNTNYSLQLDKPHETAVMKQYRKSETVILPLAVSLKKIYRCVCRAL